MPQKHILLHKTEILTASISTHIAENAVGLASTGLSTRKQADGFAIYRPTLKTRLPDLVENLRF
jgi:hypothetical protein